MKKSHRVSRKSPAGQRIDYFTAAHSPIEGQLFLVYILGFACCFQFIPDQVMCQPDYQVILFLKLVSCHGPGPGTIDQLGYG